MKFLIESKNYDIYFLNNYISLLFKIDWSNKLAHKSLAKYLKHSEKLIKEENKKLFN